MAAANTPQHILDNGTGIAEGLPDGRTAKEGSHKHTGANTSPDARNEVQDPHPSNEEHPYREVSPEGAHPSRDVPVAKDDIGPNPAKHDGKAPPRPHNRGSGPE